MIGEPMLMHLDVFNVLLCDTFANNWLWEMPAIEKRGCEGCVNW